MDQQLLQRTRYLLQLRFRKIQTAKTSNFEIVVQQVLNWLEAHPLIGAIIRQLDHVAGQHHLEIQQILSSSDLNGSRYFHLTVGRDPKQDHEPKFLGYTPKTSQEHASACLQIVRATVQRPQVSFYCLLAVYLTQDEYDEMFTRDRDPLEPIKDIAVRDLYEYIDEHLDGANAVNALLRKYKQSVEWFQQEQIRQTIQNGYNGQSGERALAVHLQQYIFEQSVEFVIEPSSTSGEVDLLLRDASGQYTIIDAKLIRQGSSPSAITRKIAEGFNQVARYCNDYSQYQGFLVVFIEDNASILLDVETADVYRYFSIGGVVIYYLEINVADRLSASKAGKAKQIHITRDMLVDELQHLT